MTQELRFEVNGREFWVYYDLAVGMRWCWEGASYDPNAIGIDFPTAHEAQADAILYASTMK